MFYVSKSDGNSDTENHKNPVDLWNVDLAMDLIRGMNDLHSREATKGLALVNNGECSTNDCLASHNRSKYSNCKHWPPHTLCFHTNIMVLKNCNLYISNESREEFRSVIRTWNGNIEANVFGGMVML